MVGWTFLALNSPGFLGRLEGLPWPGLFPTINFFVASLKAKFHFFKLPFSHFPLFKLGYSWDPPTFLRLITGVRPGFRVISAGGGFSPTQFYHFLGLFPAPFLALKFFFLFGLLGFPPNC